MANKKPQIVTIDEVEYDANNFTELQARLFNHCLDLDRKLASTVFQLEQLQVGKDEFLKRLKEELNKEEINEAET
jgi:hypothetical protein